MVNPGENKDVALNCDVTIIRICEEGMAPRSYVLENFGKSTVTIGRSDDCDILLSKDRISRRHGKFFRDGNNEHWCYQDLLSKNGSFIDNKRVEYHVITNNVCIRLPGNCTVTISLHPNRENYKVVPGPVPGGDYAEIYTGSGMTIITVFTADGTRVNEIFSPHPNPELEEDLPPFDVLYGCPNAGRMGNSQLRKQIDIIDYDETD